MPTYNLWKTAIDGQVKLYGDLAAQMKTNLDIYQAEPVDPLIYQRSGETMEVLLVGREKLRIELHEVEMEARQLREDYASTKLEYKTSETPWEQMPTELDT
jgi:hypothetical protein